MVGRMNLVALGLALAAGFVPGASAQAETLHDVLTIVYDTNPTIRAERKRLRAVSEADDQAWAGALPQISANGSLTRVDQDQTVNAAIFGQAGSTTQNFKLNPKTASVSGEQPIFTGFRNYHAIKQAGAQVRAAAAQLIAAEQQVLNEAVAAYFDVVRDMAVYNANASNVEVLRSQRRNAQVRFDVGDVTRTDVLQAEARLAGAKAELAGAKARLTGSRARFRELVGAMPGTLEPDPPMPALPASEEEAQAFARENAPQTIVVREEEKASRRQYYIENSNYYPTVSLTASYTYADEASSFVQRDEQFAYGVRATVPLFQGGLRLSRSRQAKALNERDKSRVIATDRQVEALVSSAWEQVYEARTRIESARAQVDANELALKGVKREAQLGARSTLDVLNAEQEFLNATVALATAKRDAQVASYSLLAAIGALSTDAALTATAAQAGSAEGESADVEIAPAVETEPE